MSFGVDIKIPYMLADVLSIAFFSHFKGRAAIEVFQGLVVVQAYLIFGVEMQIEFWRVPDTVQSK